MMVRRQTWFLLVLFLLLAGFAIYQKYNPRQESTSPEEISLETRAPVAYLLRSEEGSLIRLTIKDDGGNVISVERKDDEWVITQPITAAANQATVEEAVSQASTLIIVNQLNMDPAQAGLDKPAYTISVEFSSGKTITAEIGDITPTDSGYYVRKGDGNILVISKYGMEALLNLILYPPYLETPTPSPLPPTATSTPGPAKEIPTVTKMP